MDRWVRIHDHKSSTRNQYKSRMENFWKLQLKNVPIDRVRYSDILEALANGTWKCAKSRNYELSMIRGVFDLAKRDKDIIASPCDEIKGKEVRRRSPIPSPWMR